MSVIFLVHCQTLSLGSEEDELWLVGALSAMKQRTYIWETGPSFGVCKGHRQLANHRLGTQAPSLLDEERLSDEHTPEIFHIPLNHFPACSHISKARTRGLRPRGPNSHTFSNLLSRTSYRHTSTCMNPWSCLLPT
jgi:hypothetical protein